MPISVNFNGATIFLPGAYSRAQVQLNPGNPVSSAGVVGIVGEADGGAPGSVEGVQEFSINQIYDIAKKYKSGQILDAARALAQPGNDADIPAGASVVKIYKTNGSTQSSSFVNNYDGAAPTILFNIKSSNYGLSENQTNFYITQGTQPDQQCSITSGTITLPVTLTVTDTLVLNIDGVAYTFTVPGGGAGPYATVASLLTLLNDVTNWAPSKPVIASDATVGVTPAISLTLDQTQTAFLAYNKRFEYNVMYVVPGVGVTAGVDLSLSFRAPIAFASNGTAIGTFTVASLGTLGGGLKVGQKAVLISSAQPALIVRITSITGAGPYTVTVNNGATNLTTYTVAQTATISATYTGWSDANLKVSNGPSGFVRGVRGNRIFIVRNNTFTETIPENQNNVYFRIIYKGASVTATMTINDVAGVKTLTTTTSVVGDNLNLNLSLFTTIQQLVDYINNYNAGASYICVTDYYNAGVESPQHLDYYNAIDILTTPLEVKGALYEILTNVNSSQFLVATEVSNVYGTIELVPSTGRRFLVGGTRGGSSNSSFQNGFDRLLQTRCNIVVPLISEDATQDIAAGVTDATSTYTISSILAQTDAHCRLASNVKNRSERNAYASIKDTFTNSISASQTLNSEYVSLALQDVKALDGNGNAVWFQPWMFATLAAGMQAGSDIGTPLTHKYMNAIGIRHASFDPKTQYDQAIINGLLFAQQPDSGGVRIAVGNTTYLKDNNPVFNRISVFEIVNYVAYDSRVQLENAFIGKSRASGTSLAVAIQTFFRGILSGYTRQQLLTPDANNKGLGFKDVTVTLQGDIVQVSAVITPAPGIDFILINLTIAQVSDVA